MKPDRFLMASVACLAFGLLFAFGYCNGTAFIWARWALSAVKLNICVTTTEPGALGRPALMGLDRTCAGDFASSHHRHMSVSSDLLLVTWPPMPARIYAPAKTLDALLFSAKEARGDV
jgi:hypothetical protein